MNVGFLTFAGGDLLWKLALKRIHLQAINAGVFSHIRVYNPHELEDIATKSDKEFIDKNSFGYGYWLWKPVIILHFLESYPDIEAFLYTDAGCDLNFNPESTRSWRSYVDYLSEHQAIAFKMELIERYWTKKEVVDYFPEFSQHLDSEQLLGGVFLMRRQYAIDFCTKWLDAMRASNYTLLDDSHDSTIQSRGFVHHRHDQSLFSLLSKSESRVLVLDSLKEVYFEPHWSHGFDKPIWTSRNKSFVPKYKSTVSWQLIRIMERAYRRITK